MSFFTRIRDVVTAPAKSFIAFDPLAHKLATGKFSLSVKGYKERVAAGVHELYKNDRLAQKLGIKESSVTKVAVVAGYVVATYFTAGAASGLLSSGGAAAGGGTGITAAGAGEAASAALSAAKMLQQKKAAEQEIARQQALQPVAPEPLTPAVQVPAPPPQIKPAHVGIGLATIAALVALL